MNKKLLNEILSQPTAPFRESFVKSTISAALRKEGVPFFEDPIGNIVVGVASEAEYRAVVQKTSDEPVRVFIAHMDHPGFHGVKWSSTKELQIKWLGGSPKKLLNGANVWVTDNDGTMRDGVFAKAKLLKSGAAMESGVVRFKAPIVDVEAKSLFGGLRFRAPVWWKKDVIYTKAADDLVGAFVVTSLGIAMAQGKSGDAKGNFIGLLTRAEEVGFIGAIGHFDLGWLDNAKRRVLCVSLETSRTLPGAIVGKGPVVRLGDRATTFDAGSLNVFSDLARKVLPGKHQRRIMDGGTCEGTVATAYGYPTVGISIPLGNYHNQSFEGGPDSRGPLGPAPEFVHSKDIEGMLKLCHSLFQPGLAWKQPWDRKIEEFRQWKKDSKELLALT